jgi:hypothetical protein
MTAIYNISVGGTDIARAILSLTSQKEIVIHIVEGDCSVRLIGTDMRYLCNIIANHLVAKHGDKKLEAREAKAAELPDFERKFREIKDELLQFLRK